MVPPAEGLARGQTGLLPPSSLLNCASKLSKLDGAGSLVVFWAFVFLFKNTLGGQHSVWALL